MENSDESTQTGTIENSQGDVVDKASSCSATFPLERKKGGDVTAWCQATESLLSLSKKCDDIISGDIKSNSSSPSLSSGSIPVTRRRGSTLTTKTGSTVTLMYEDGEYARLYRTSSDHRKRGSLLRSLSFGRRSRRALVTVADVGVQMTPLDCPYRMFCEDLQSQLKEVVNVITHLRDINVENEKSIADLAEKSRSIETQYRLEREKFTDTEQQLGNAEKVAEEKDHEMADLKKALVDLEEQKESYQLQCVSKEAELLEVGREKEALKREIEAISAHLEKSEMEVAFLQQEKEELDKSLCEKDEMNKSLNKDLHNTKSKKKEYKELFIETRRKSNEVISKYLNDLNNSLEDKKALMEKTIKGRDLKKLMATTQDYMKIEAEKTRLTDKLEHQELLIFEQQLHIDHLQEKISEMSQYIGQNLSSLSRTSSLRSSLSANGDVPPTMKTSAMNLSEAPSSEDPNLSTASLGDVQIYSPMHGGDRKHKLRTNRSVDTVLSPSH